MKAFHVCKRVVIVGAKIRRGCDRGRYLRKSRDAAPRMVRSLSIVLPGQSTSA